MTTTSPLLSACAALLSLASLLASPLAAQDGPLAAQDGDASTPSEWSGAFLNPNTNQITLFELRSDELFYLSFYNDTTVAEAGRPPQLPSRTPDWTASFKIRDLKLMTELHAARFGSSSNSEYIAFSIVDRRLRVLLDQGVPLWVAASSSLTLLLVGGLTVGIYLTSRESRRRRAAAEERQRTFHAREAERSRLARELHDGPLQDVHALRMLSGRRTPEAVDEEAARIARELRAIAEGLRPPALGRFGLSAALSAHANRVKDRHPDVLVRLDLDEDGVGARALPDIVRSSLFRIVQESITNAIEHGGADVLSVALNLPAEPGGIVRVSVSDNGAGFGWEDAPDLAALADGGHFGLVGMHERAAAIGGTLELLPKGLSGRGATVRVTLPDPGPASGAHQRAHHHATT